MTAPAHLIDLLHRGASAGTPATAPDEAVLALAGTRLDAFADTLSPEEQTILRALLDLTVDADPYAALGRIPAEQILTPREQAYFEQIAAEPPPAVAGPRATVTAIMKATRLCNLRCTYCHSWREGPNQVMSFPVLARTIRDLLRDPGVRHAEFVWHGGEVTLLPPSWYRTALWLQTQFRRPGQQVNNSILTNGTRITDDWLAFLQRYRFNVAVSLDGPPEIHDRRRVDRMGRATSAQVRDSLARLQSAGLARLGILIVVDDAICDAGAARVLEYVLELGVTGVGLLNVIPENTPADAETRGDYLPIPRFLTFLQDLFRLWWPRYADRVAFRELADLAGQLTGGAPVACVFAGDCFGRYLTVDPTGDIAVCDKYIDDDAYRFGNVLTLNLADVQRSPRLAEIRAENDAAVDRQRGCPWFGVCHGGCPHDRYTAERRLGGANPACCGFAPLLADMAQHLRATGIPVTAGPDAVPPRRRTQHDPARGDEEVKVVERS